MVLSLTHAACVGSVQSVLSLIHNVGTVIDPCCPSLIIITFVTCIVIVIIYIYIYIYINSFLKDFF